MINPGGMSATAVPEGDPEALRGAARTFSAAADSVETQAAKIQGASEVQGSSWFGLAALAFGAVARRIATGDARTASSAFRTAAGALNAYAAELQEAQTKARLAQQRQADLAATSANLDVQMQDALQSLAGAKGEAHGLHTHMQSLANQSREVSDQMSIASAEGAAAVEQARAAAVKAAAAFDDVTSMAPSVRRALTARAMAMAESGNTAWLRMDLDDFTDSGQRWAGQELAELVRAEMDSDDPSISRLSPFIAVVDEYRDDPEFTAGFFTALGGAGATGLVREIQGYSWISNTMGAGYDNPFMDPHHNDFVDDDRNLTTEFLVPLSIALGTATKSGQLDDDFTDELLGKGKGRDEQDPWAVGQLLRFGDYETDFLVDVAQQVVVDEIVLENISNRQVLPWGERPLWMGDDGDYVDPKQGVLDALARNPEASAQVLLGEYTGEFSVPDYGGFPTEDVRDNLSIMLRGHYADGGEKLAEIVDVAAHDLHDTDPATANQVALEVIRKIPDHTEAGFDIPEPLYDPLVTITRDHIESFSDAAINDVLHRTGNLGADPTLVDDSFTGSSDANGIRVGYAQVDEFLTELLKREEVRPAITDIYAVQTHSLIDEALSMPDTGEQDQILRAAGATQSQYAIAYQHAIEDMGRNQDFGAGLLKQAIGEATGILTAKLDTVVGKPLGHAVGLVLDQIIASDNELRARGEGELFELRTRFQLEAAIAYEAMLDGDLTPEQYEMVLKQRFATNEVFDDINDVIGKDSNAINNGFNVLRDHRLDYD
jgi:hypothetical protein